MASSLTNGLTDEQVEQTKQNLFNGEAPPLGVTLDSALTPPFRATTEQDVYAAENGVRFENGEIVNSHFTHTGVPGGLHFDDTDVPKLTKAEAEIEAAATDLGTPSDNTPAESTGTTAPRATRAARSS